MHSFDDLVMIDGFLFFWELITSKLFIPWIVNDLHIHTVTYAFVCNLRICKSDILSLSFTWHQSIEAKKAIKFYTRDIIKVMSFRFHSYIQN